MAGKPCVLPIEVGVILKQPCGSSAARQKFGRMLCAFDDHLPGAPIKGLCSNIVVSSEVHNCPAVFRSAAKVANAITSVRGLLLKATAP